MSNSGESDDSESDEQAQAEHLEEISSGCGCVEVWENLSEQRQQTE